MKLPVHPSNSRNAARKAAAAAIAAAFLALPLQATAQDDEEALKNFYSFPSANAITQVEPYYTVVYCATANGVQNTTGLEFLHSKDPVKSIALNPSGINFAVITTDKKGKSSLNVYSTRQVGENLMKFDSKKYGEPLAAAFTPDARQLVVATATGTWLFETKKYRESGQLPAFTNNPDRLVFSPNSYFLAAAGDGKVVVMNFEEKTVRRTLNVDEKVTDVAFSANSEDMAVLTADGMAEVYDTRKFNVRVTVDDLDNGVACDFNDNGKYLAIIDKDNEAQVINLLKPDNRITVEIPNARLADLSFIKDAYDRTLLATGSDVGVNAMRMRLEPYYAKLVSDEVDMKMAEWMKMQPDESMEDYRLRVNDETRAKQRRLFEDEISTQLAGNLAAMSSVSLGKYDAEFEMLEVMFDNMPSIFLPMPRADLGGLTSGDDLVLSDAQYGLMDDDNFELIYAKFTNKNTGETYVYDNTNRKPMNFMQNDNVVSIELVQQQMMEEIKLQEIKEQIVEEAKKDNIISDHTQITVDSEVIPVYDANGNKIMNYNVNFTYQVDPEFSAAEDFAPGKYRAEQSGAASAMLDIVKKAFEGDFARYVKPGKKLEVTISGTADATPIIRTIAYDGAYGDIEDEPVYQDDKLSAITVTQKGGVDSNEQLAFLRAYGVKNFLQENVQGLQDMNTGYTYDIKVSKDKGSEHRRITVGFVFVDAF